MGEINIIGLLQRFSGEIVIASVIASGLSLAIKKLCKLTTKFFITLSFLFGAACYAVLDCMFLKEGAVGLLTNAITCGVLTVTLGLFMKRFTFSDSDDLKKSLEKLLSSIVLSEQLDEVVDSILEKLSKSSDATAESLKEIISNNVSESLGNEELDSIVSFIIAACDLGEKKDGD